jgi:hypothetical protein
LYKYHNQGNDAIKELTLISQFFAGCFMKLTRYLNAIWKTQRLFWFWKFSKTCNQRFRAHKLIWTLKNNPTLVHVTHYHGKIKRVRTLGGHIMPNL